MDKSDLGEEHKYEITESMRQEMEYNADLSWYLNFLVLKSIFLLYPFKSLFCIHDV